MEQPKILVAIRKRPLSKKELSRGEGDIVSVKNSDTVIVSEYKYIQHYTGKRLT
jgi:kinesin family protein 2/24